MAKVLVSEICGLCAGALNAILKTREVATKEKNVTLFKELLHNKNVIKELQSKGVTTKNTLEEITNNDYVIIRAHGEPKQTYDILNTRKINYLDLTCANVKAINMIV